MTGITGAFLLVDFLIVTTDFATRLGVGSAGAAVGAVCGDKIVDGLAAFFLADQDEVGCFCICGGEGFCGHGGKFRLKSDERTEAALIFSWRRGS